jgi:hypothetical protein
MVTSETSHQQAKRAAEAPGAALVCAGLLAGILVWWRNAPHQDVTWAWFRYASYAGAGFGALVALSFEANTRARPLLRVVRSPFAVAVLTLICAVSAALLVVVPLSVASYCIQNSVDWWPRMATGAGGGHYVFYGGPGISLVLHTLYAIVPPFVACAFVCTVGGTLGAETAFLLYPDTVTRLGVPPTAEEGDRGTEDGA